MFYSQKYFPKLNKEKQYKDLIIKNEKLIKNFC